MYEPLQHSCTPTLLYKWEFILEIRKKKFFFVWV